MKKIGYMGFNERMILEIMENKECRLNFVITQKGRLSNTMLKLLQVMKIPYYVVESKKDLLQYDNIYKKVDLILAHCFGIIIPDTIVEKYACFNIHGGDLKTNRGPYPIVRNILNNDAEAVYTLHKIGKDIDTGVVLGQYKVKITNEDNDITLANKLEDGLGYLLNELLKYDENKEYQIVKEGKYYKKVEDKDITIKNNDSYIEMNRKIRAQKSYGGALANYNGYLVRISQIMPLN